MQYLVFTFISEAVQRQKINGSIVVMAAHLGFVNGAVQRIVLLVIQQTEVQGPQSSCEREIRKRKEIIKSQRRNKLIGILSSFERC